jgi:hypothetical protein
VVVGLASVSALAAGLVWATPALGAGAVTVDDTAAAESAVTVQDAVTVENVANAELLSETDAGAPAGWSWLGWDGRGDSSVGRVIVDDSEPAHHDGSLRIATPDAGDTVQVRQVVPPNRTDGPSLQSVTAAGVDVRVVTGTAPDLIVKVDCGGRASSSPEAAFTLTYAGAVDADGAWHHVDLVAGGDAMWWSDMTMNADGTPASPAELPTEGGLKGGPGSPHPWSEFARVCTDGLLRSYGFRQDVPGSNGFVDSLTVGDRSTNFWVPPLQRVAGADRRATACATAEHYFTSPADLADQPNPGRVRHLARAVVLVNDDSFADALAAGPLAARLDAPLLLNHGAGLNTGCGAWTLTDGDPVYIVGGPSVVSAQVESDLRARGLVPLRVSGDDRYETAVEVARAIDALRPVETSQTLFLASGTDFVDALSAGAPAGDANGAVILTNGPRMAPATAAYLRTRPGATVFAVGGPAAAAASLPASNEIVGPNRYETATMVADRFFPDAPSAAFASGVQFPDALAGGAYGGNQSLPVLLVGPDGVPNAVFAWASAHRSTVRGTILLGGQTAVNRLVFDILLSRLTPPA